MNRLLRKDRVILVQSASNVSGGVVQRVTTNIQSLEGTLVVMTGDSSLGPDDLRGSVIEHVSRVELDEQPENIAAYLEEGIRFLYSKERWTNAVTGGKTELGYEAWVKEMSK